MNLINIAQDVEEIKNGLTLTMISNFAENVMPPQYQPDRATIVALSQLLLNALQQNQTMAEALRTRGADKPH